MPRGHLDRALRRLFAKQLREGERVGRNAPGSQAKHRMRRQGKLSLADTNPTQAKRQAKRNRTR